MEKLLALGTLLFATFLFGASNPVQKTVLGEMDVWSALGWRGAIAMLVLLPFTIPELSRLRRARRQLMTSAIPVVAWFSIAMAAQLLGAAQTTATNVGFLINTCVMFVPFIVWFRTGESPSLRIWLSCGACFVGIALLSGFAPHGFAIGDVFCLVSAFAYAFWITSLGHVMQRFNAPITITAAQWLPVCILGFGMSDGGAGIAGVWAVGGELAFLGIIVSGLAFLLAARAQALITPCAAAVCYTMEAVFGAALSNVMLGETLGLAGIAGAAITVVSLVLVQCDGIWSAIQGHVQRIRKPQRMVAGSRG